MSQKDMTEELGHHGASDRSIGYLSKLAMLARQAYDQKRTKDCLDLTRAMLLIDPDNVDAQRMRSSIRSQMQRDLEDARAFFDDLRPKETPELEPAPPPIHIQPLANEILGVTKPHAATPPRPRKRWLTYSSIVIGLGVTALAVASFRPNPVWLPTQPLTAPDQAGAAANMKPVQPEELPGPQPVDVSIAGVNPGSLTGDRPPLLEAPAPQPSTKVSGPDLHRPDGTLAINSPTTVDIYKGDLYLGSTPVSLALPAGVQTLEYRHGNLRRTLTHQINSDEITKAMVTFDVNIKINAKPWAEVFQEGVERKDLGQTPLSGVRVPIGSVLVFENPQFPPKKYRVTGNETGIQIVFP
jgi:hypothetical protein